MNKNIAMALILTIFSMPSFGDVEETGNISRIIIEGDTNISVFLDGADVSTECSGGGRWTLETNDALFKEKYAALLAASTSRKSVRLYHLSALNCGPFNSNKIYFIDVQY